MDRTDLETFIKGKGHYIRLFLSAASVDKPHPQFGNANLGKNKNNKV